MGKPPTPGQVGILSFFGRNAATSAEAHKLITELLANGANARAWQCERARRFVAKMEPAISGSGGHNATFHVACVLVHGFALSVAEALPIFQEYNQRCSPPWSDPDLAYKLNSAERTAHEKPRGHLLGDDFVPAARGPVGAATVAPRPAPVSSPRKLVAFDPARLRDLAAKFRDVVTVEWLGNRSAADPSVIGAKDFLKAIYRPGEKVLLFTVYKSQGQALWPNEEVPAAGEDGVWFLAQPVTGEKVPNPRTQKMSRRSMEVVTEFRYLVLESDQADVSDWLGLIVQLPLRIEAMYTSGGKSVHALVRVDCSTHRQWEDYVRQLMPTLNLLGMAGVDPKTLTSVRLTRLPGCFRGDRMQKLLFFMPQRGPEDVRAIAEMPITRDVAAGWLAQANAVVDGHAEASRELRRGLWYYAPCNRSCRTALRDVEALEPSVVD